jgi:hypothetical protein
LQLAGALATSCTADLPDGTRAPIISDQVQQDRRFAVEVLVGLLASQAADRAMPDLVKALVKRMVTSQDRATVRAALLERLSHEGDLGIAYELVLGVASSRPAESEWTQALSCLFELLVNSRNDWQAERITRRIPRLALSSRDRANARKILLALIRGTGWHIARSYAFTLVRLVKTPEERADLLEALIRLRSVADQSPFEELSNAICALHPSSTDLAGSYTWVSQPSDQLLAAARSNSTLDSWLASLPTLRSNRMMGKWPPAL